MHAIEDVLDLSKAISLTEAAKLIRGKGGRPPSVVTLRRWANPRKGCYPQGAGGPCVVLHTVRVSGDILTTREWVEAFERARVKAGDRLASPVRSPRAAKAAHRRAEAELDRKGIGGKNGGAARKG